MGLAGTGENAGKLIFQSGNRDWVIGKTVVPRWTWAKVQFVRDGNTVRVNLNDNPEPEIKTDIPFDLPLGVDDLFLGGRGSRDSSWEGRIDEVAIFRKPLLGP